MSYCIKDGESNIHIFQNSFLIFCHQCILTEHQTSVAFDDRSKVISHVTQHSMKNHKVPNSIIAMLIAEISQVGAKVTGKEEWTHERSIQHNSTT